MKLPEITHLQFLILEALGARRLSGRELRERLKEVGADKSLPAFYQLMSRLEDADFVKGDMETKTVEDVVLKEKFYRLTGHGARAHRDTLRFYSERAATAGALA